MGRERTLSFPLNRPREIHQLLAALSYGDAVSNDALALQAHLRRAGFVSDIFAEAAHPRLAASCRRIWEYEEVSGPETVCLYHFAIGSAAGPLIFHAKDRLVVRYHNITPARFFAGFLPHLARQCERGRRQLADFAPRAELALGVSEFNRRELEEAGFLPTGVLPILVEPRSPGHRGAEVLRRTYGDGRTNVLFVGRIICNKKIEDLIRTIAYYQRFVDTKVRLLVVGDHFGYEPYFLRVQQMGREMGVEEVVFTGQVDDDELQSFYDVAHVYLSLSEHEGFCVPLLEAMAHDLPVLAYDAGAVAETLAGAGILLRDKRPEVVAELMHAVLTRREVRESVLAGQRRALAARRAVDYGALLLERLAPVLGPPSRR